MLGKARRVTLPQIFWSESQKCCCHTESAEEAVAKDDQPTLQPTPKSWKEYMDDRSYWLYSLVLTEMFLEHNYSAWNKFRHAAVMYD